MRHLTPADYQRMPWRNGGGTTTEIAIAPEGAGLTGERFLYRMSIADVGTSGPFSRFEGYDRHIMLIDGAGMMLDGGIHGTIALDTLFAPRSFSGDWEIDGTLTSGPVRDFNLIVDRARASGELASRVVTAHETIAVSSGETVLLHLLSGDLDVGRVGDTLVADAPFEIAPVSASARVVVARVVTRS